MFSKMFVLAIYIVMITVVSSEWLTIPYTPKPGDKLVIISSYVGDQEYFLSINDNGKRNSVSFNFGVFDHELILRTWDLDDNSFCTDATVIPLEDASIQLHNIAVLGIQNKTFNVKFNNVSGSYTSTCNSSDFGLTKFIAFDKTDSGTSHIMVCKHVT